MRIHEFRDNGTYVCWANISGIDPDDTRGFSERRIKKLESIRNENEKRRSAGAELMLIHAVTALFPDCAPPMEYGDDENGKPYFTESDGIWLSLSHSGEYAVCAVSDRPVGVDIQSLRRPNEGIARRCFTERERAAAADDASFTALWARKEAVSKAVGLGIQIGFSDIDVLGSEVSYDGASYSVEDIDCMDDGYRMALSRLVQRRFEPR